MKLSRLLATLTSGDVAAPAPDTEVTGIALDSRQVRPGHLFVAIPGAQVDGHRFIESAIERGASAVVGERPLRELRELLPEVDLSDVPYLKVPDSRRALAHLSAAFYGHPGRQLKIIGVTGTDGKTTTVRLIAAILNAAGHPTGLVSSVSAVIGGQESETGFHTTTPEAPEVQAYLARMVEAGMEYAVLESTSHGLAQHRVTACEYDVAALTNITHEHLDYHGTFEAYREAKALLFRSLADSYRKEGTAKVAILNADDQSYQYMAAIAADRHLSYGLDGPADLTATEIEPRPRGSCFLAHTPAGDVHIQTALPGRFNVYNILAAMAVGVSQGLPLEAIQRGVSSLRGVAGRMERIDLGQDFTAIVDFAHTPNALRRALETARTMTAGRVIVVFGCAGLRDHEKRAPMGRIAVELADQVVITAEDPRTESLDAITSQIAEGCDDAGGREGRDYWRIADRGEAIGHAVDLAEAGDLVILTGKGHERSMCFGTTEHPWSDHDALETAIRERLRAV